MNNVKDSQQKLMVKVKLLSKMVPSWLTRKEKTEKTKAKKMMMHMPKKKTNRKKKKRLRNKLRNLLSLGHLSWVRRMKTFRWIRRWRMILLSVSQTHATSYVNFVKLSLFLMVTLSKLPKKLTWFRTLNASTIYAAPTGMLTAWWNSRTLRFIS